MPLDPLPPPVAGLVHAPPGRAQGGTATPTLSVIVPQGGAERLGTLGPVLRQLNRLRPAPEVILVEMDSHSRAAPVAAGLVRRHLWVRGEPFQLARARNLGLSLAQGEIVAWLDNDLLVPDGLLDSAAAEMAERGLDFMYPWAVIHYLSAEDSRAVVEGTRRPEDCTPINSLWGNANVGAMMMARRDFVARYGAFDERFRGWGHEDRAMLHRASILGRSGRTNRADQAVYHLYHPESYGNPGSKPHAHPGIRQNAALAERVRACRDRATLLARFPAPAHFSAPWTGVRHVWAEGAAAPVLDRLVALYGGAVRPAAAPGDAHLVLPPLPPASPDPARAALEAALDAACRLAALEVVPPPAPEPPPRPAPPANARTLPMTWKHHLGLPRHAAHLLQVRNQARTAPAWVPPPPAPAPAPAPAPSAPPAGEPPLLLVGEILARMRQVPGWLSDEEADLLVGALTHALLGRPGPHAVVEVGSYHGRSTLVLGSVLRALSPDSRLYAIDPHEGVVYPGGDGRAQMPPSLDAFRQTIADAGLGGVVELVHARAHEVAWDKPVSMAFIDGLHDYEDVSRDFRHFEPWLAPGALVAFHDHSDEFPGVVRFLGELLADPAYRRVTQRGSLVLVERTGPDATPRQTPAGR